MSGDETRDFESLRRVVEAIDELADDDQIQGPTSDEVAEELDVSKTTVSRWTDRDYNHAVRTAGLIPRKNRNIGDYMVVYDELNKSEKEITKEVIERENSIGSLGVTDKNLSHNQAREKIGLNPNPGRPNRHELPFPGKIHGEEGEIYEHRLRGAGLQLLEEKDRVPLKEELNDKVGIPDDLEYNQLRKAAGFPPEPVYVEGQGPRFMSADRENEVFDFWVSQYLEEDWRQYDETEVDTKFVVDTIMKRRMNDKDISENELNAVASQYRKWIDFDRYQSE